MSRSPQDVFAAHAASLASADLPAVLADYTDDAVLMPLLLVWSAEATGARITDAVDTFVFADGLIRLQTTVFTLQTTS